MSPAPALSVVIPTRRRAPVLGRALDALARQTVPAGTFEVVVVHNDEDPHEQAAVRAVVQAARPFTATVVVEPRAGASAARNTGLRTARAPLVLFLDDDILASPRLVEEHLRWHRERGGERVGVLGAVAWAGEVTVTPFMRWLEDGTQFDFGAIEGDEAGWFHLYTANVSAPRRALEAAGGFDAERFPFGYEDLDLGYRLHQQGFRLLYNRRAAAEHLHQASLDEWQRRVARIASAERRWVAHRPEMPAYFHDRFAAALARRPYLGAGRALLRWARPRSRAPLRWAWHSADAYYLRRLAPAFLAQWERDAPDGQVAATGPACRR